MIASISASRWESSPIWAGSTERGFGGAACSVAVSVTNRGASEGISEGTSKSQLSRAKVILQDMVRRFIDQHRGATSEQS